MARSIESVNGDDYTIRSRETRQERLLLEEYDGKHWAFGRLTESGRVVIVHFFDTEKEARAAWGALVPLFGSGGADPGPRRRASR